MTLDEQTEAARATLATLGGRENENRVRFSRLRARRSAPGRQLQTVQSADCRMDRLEH